jgi:hypothetical protein
MSVLLLLLLLGVGAVVEFDSGAPRIRACTAGGRLASVDLPMPG